MLINFLDVVEILKWNVQTVIKQTQFNKSSSGPHLELCLLIIGLSYLVPLLAPFNKLFGATGSFKKLYGATHVFCLVPPFSRL